VAPLLRVPASVPLAWAPARVGAVSEWGMARPVLFEHNRWLGDKRDQRVHDLDHLRSECDIDELVEAGTFTTFGPDEAAEARNRGYRLHLCARDDEAAGR